MGFEMEIVANNGKVYKSTRAYRIALGHAVRQALIDFSKEVEECLQKKVAEFYGEYNPMYYDRSYQLENKMRLGKLIKMSIKGNFEGKYELEYELFDWQVLDPIERENGFGELGSYSDFYQHDSREGIESILQDGITGHSPFDLYEWVDDYVNNHLDDRIQKVLDDFG